MKVNYKELDENIKQLLVKGAIALFGGIGCLVILLKVIVTYPTINLLFGVIGLIFGYYCVTYLDPGGTATFHYFTPRNHTAEERALYDLVVRYKSRVLLRLVTFILVALVAIVGLLFHNNTYSFGINNILWLLFWATFTMLLTGSGVKYISAWWNIRNKEIAHHG